MMHSPSAPAIGSPSDTIRKSHKIAEHLGIGRTCFHFRAARGEIPGLFRDGSVWCLSKETHRRAIEARIEASCQKVA